MSRSQEDWERLQQRFRATESMEPAQQFVANIVTTVDTYIAEALIESRCPGTVAEKLRMVGLTETCRALYRIESVD